MCTLAPRAAAAPAGLGATAFLDSRRGVVAALPPPPVSSSEGKTTGKPPMRRARAAAEVSIAPAPKRGRPFHDVVVVDPASSSSSALRVRMDTELVNLQGLLKRAKLLPALRSAPTAENKCAPPVVSPAAAAKRRASASPSKPAATEAASAPVKQQRCPVMQRAATKNPIAPEVLPNNKQRPAEAPPATKQHPVQREAAAKTTEVPKTKRLPEEEEKELARAAARAEFRQMLVEMEKSAMPDETIYPEELEALGIPFEFVITRTWKQAQRDYAAKKLELAGV